MFSKQHEFGNVSSNEIHDKQYCASQTHSGCRILSVLPHPLIPVRDMAEESPKSISACFLHWHDDTDHGHGVTRLEPSAPTVLPQTRIDDYNASSSATEIGAAVECTHFAGGATTLERAQRSVLVRKAYQVCTACVAAVCKGNAVSGRRQGGFFLARSRSHPRPVLGGRARADPFLA